MSHMLLWAEACVAGIAWSAAWLAWGRRADSGAVRAVGHVAALLVPWVAWGAVLGLTTYVARTWGLGGLLSAWVGVGLGVQVCAQLALLVRRAAPVDVGRAATTCALATVLMVLTAWNADLAVQQRLTSLRAEAGASIVSVVPPRPNDRDNAALLYEQAAEARVAPDESIEAQCYGWLDADRSLDVDTTAPRVAEHLARNARALELVRRGVRLPGCDFGHCLVQIGTDMMLPELTGIRQVARLLALSARAHAQRGRGAEALIDLDAIHALATHTASGPALIHLLVAFASEHVGLRALTGVARDLAADPPRWEMPALEAATMTGRQQLRRSLLAEQAFGLSAFAGLSISSLDELGTTDSTLPVPELLGGPALMVWRVFYLEADLASYRASLSQAIARLSPEHPIAPTASAPPRGMLARVLVPSLDRSVASARRMDAFRALARTALRCLRHRAAHAAFPTTQTDLEGPPLLDPYDGAPLRLRLESSGELVVYSIGPDARDDGGRPIPFGAAEGEGDFTLRLAPRPAK